MFVRVTYSNGYAGCDESEVLEVKTMQEAEAYAEDYIFEYAESYNYIVSGWGEDMTEEEEEDYYSGCNYCIEEITEEEYMEEL